MKFSLRTPLAGLWLLIVLFCAGLAYLLNGLYDQSVSAQLRQADARLMRAVEDLSARFERYRVTFDDGQVPIYDAAAHEELSLLATTALAPFPGVEGGFWQEERGAIAYAFPTYEGNAARKEAPAAELGRVASAVVAGQRTGGKSPALRYVGQREALLVLARPLTSASSPGEKSALSAWVMVRVPVSLARPYEHFAGG